MERQTMTVEEAAKVLGIGRNQAYEAARNGQIPVIKIGRRLLVSRTALDRMINTVTSGEETRPGLSA